MLQSSLRRWPLLFAAWTLLALSFAAQFYLSSSQAGLVVSWRQVLGGALGDWYVVAILSWPALLLARACQFRRDRWFSSAAIHLFAAVLFSGAFIVLRALVARWQGWAADRPVAFLDAVRPLAVKTWHFNLIIYAVIVGAAQAVRFYRESQDRTVHALELEKRLAEARLLALQMQLNPHFLFNALNSIATLIHRDPKAADRMLIRLAELLRMTLDNTSSQEIALRTELSLLERYMDIERIRFGDRLTFRLDVPLELQTARVPTLLLQPIVENSLKHGLGGVIRPGVVEVKASRRNGTLCLTVSDNGKGLPTNATPQDGIGLSNTRARLQHLYGNHHQLLLENRPEGGLAVTIELPLRSLPEH
ncbi:MAG TPA: histidine kinase [Verrucomicrobiae bacterium]|nr:histidine kinase [Verrucomicrobiae bacterium]